jgi:hypothetical protein
MRYPAILASRQRQGNRYWRLAVNANGRWRPIGTTLSPCWATIGAWCFLFFSRACACRRRTPGSRNETHMAFQLCPAVFTPSSSSCILRSIHSTLPPCPPRAAATANSIHKPFLERCQSCRVKRPLQKLYVRAQPSYAWCVRT